jgi:glutathione S-transferase
MPDYAVLYFDIRGRAEPIRLLFAAADVAFDDRNVPREHWMAIKATLPLGQVPVLYEMVGGHETALPHSMAILRHLGRTFGRAGDTDAERLQADLCAESVIDARVPLVPHVSPMTRGKDPAGLARTMNEAVPLQLSRLEKIAAQSRSARGLLVNDRLTWVDCFAYDLLDALTTVAPTILDATPRLKAFVAAFRADPAIAAYLPRQRASELAVLRTVLETGQPL